MSEIHAVRLFQRRLVLSARLSAMKGGDREIEQPLSLYRLATLRFPNHIQRACTITLYLCALLPFSDLSAQEAVASTSQPPSLPPVTHAPIPPLLPASFHNDPYMWAVVDPDIPRDNAVEDKHRRLVRSHRSSPYDRELKPNTKLRDELGVRFVLTLHTHTVQ